MPKVALLLALGTAQERCDVPLELGKVKRSHRQIKNACCLHPSGFAR